MTDGSGSISLEIAVSLHDTAWLDGCADLEKRSRAAASAALRHLKVEDGPLELSLVFTDDAEQRALNRAWRNQDRTTNVQSFLKIGRAHVSNLVTNAHLVCHPM